MDIRELLRKAFIEKDNGANEEINRRLVKSLGDLMKGPKLILKREPELIVDQARRVIGDDFGSNGETGLPEGDSEFKEYVESVLREILRNEGEENLSAATDTEKPTSLKDMLNRAVFDKDETARFSILEELKEIGTRLKRAKGRPFLKDPQDWADTAYKSIERRILKNGMPDFEYGDPSVKSYFSRTVNNVILKEIKDRDNEIKSMDDYKRGQLMKQNSMQLPFTLDFIIEEKNRRNSLFRVALNMCVTEYLERIRSKDGYFSYDWYAFKAWIMIIASNRYGISCKAAKNYLKDFDSRPGDEEFYKIRHIVAKKMGVDPEELSINTIKSKAHRARNYLKQCIKSQGIDRSFFEIWD